LIAYLISFPECSVFRFMYILASSFDLHLFAWECIVACAERNTVKQSVCGCFILLLLRQGRRRPIVTCSGCRIL
jgi:hypothetical protein